MEALSPADSLGIIHFSAAVMSAGEGTVLHNSAGLLAAEQRTTLRTTICCLDEAGTQKKKRTQMLLSDGLKDDDTFLCRVSDENSSSRLSLTLGAAGLQ